MDKNDLKKEVYQYRMDHGYPEDGDELLTFAKHIVNWYKDNIWHAPDEEPETERTIMWENEVFFGKHLFAGQWNAKIDCFGRKQRWCYVSDVRPLHRRKKN